MKRGKIAALVAAALVAGLALGTGGAAFAAPAQVATATAGFGALCRQAGGTIADVVAKVTAQPVADVYAARAKGQSFAAIATAKGVPTDTLTADVLAARKTALDAAVKAGTITQAQADTMLANLKARVASRITSNSPGACTGTGPAGGKGRGAGAGACGGACLGQ